MTVPGCSKAQSGTNTANTPGPTLNNILPKLTNICSMTIIDASSGYHKLDLYKTSSCLTTFSFQFSRYRFIRLPFGVASAGDIFQKKTDEILKGLPNVFGIADIILTAGYNTESRDHDRTL